MCKCSCCGWRFAKGEKAYQSNLKGVWGVIICSACAQNEARRIKEANTDNIPDLSKEYDRPLSLW